MKLEKIDLSISCWLCSHHETCKLMYDFPRTMFNKKMPEVMIVIANMCDYYRNESWYMKGEDKDE